MSDYNALVHRPQGGASLEVDTGGAINFEDITFTLTAGNLILGGVPTSDPAVVGALWNNAGVLTVSAG